MRYEGPIYRPPSEADSLLIQATVGCPHNQCTFCMVYKEGPRFKVRPLSDILEDMEEAAADYGNAVRRLFLPAGNTIAMKTRDLAEICRAGYRLFPRLQRVTVYGSFQYIHAKGLDGLHELSDAGLSRIHVGMESGDDAILQQIRKGTNSKEQIKAGQWVKETNISLSLYVLLGIGGRTGSRSHALESARVLNAINPDFIRLRTFLPKINTALLDDIKAGEFDMLGPHEVLNEIHLLLENLEVSSHLTSDHYTNYINLEGILPGDKEKLFVMLDKSLQKREEDFRPIYIGTQ